MRPPRVSILGLMAFVVCIAIAFAALRFSTPTVAAISILMTSFGLALAILSAIYRRESHRAFWLGFALLGWGYLGYSCGSWTLSDDETANGWVGSHVAITRQQPNPKHWLGTTTLLDALRPSAQASSGGFSNQVTGFPGLTVPRTNAIFAALNRPVTLRFPNDTPLEELLKTIKSDTRGPSLPDGIPIYVDPIGLKESEIDMSSPIGGQIEDVPLRIALKLFLKQLHLTFRVDDGLLTITSLDTNDTPPNPEAVESFRRVGHCGFSLIFALIGGLAARLLHATRDARAL